MIIETVLCQRCKKIDAVLCSRKEYFCPVCFEKFVSLKQRKQMMSDNYFQDIFKVIYGDKLRSVEEASTMNRESRVLVPLSFGSSSLLTLDILHGILKEQFTVHRGTVGFTLDAVTCCRYQEMGEVRRRLHKLRDRYSDSGVEIKFHLIDLDKAFETCNDHIRIVLNDSTFSSRYVALERLQKVSMSDVLKECGGKSAQEDLVTAFTDRIVKDFAQRGNYKAILWGHSMTRLADEVISLVVKGRGAQIADTLNTSDFDESFGGEFKPLYPLRDVLLSEVDALCHLKGLAPLLYKYAPNYSLLLVRPSEADKITPKPKYLPKNMTINGLARKYFDDIEDNYSNVISTVVRTGAKLAPPTCEVDNAPNCTLCRSMIYKDAPGWLQSITENLGHPIEDDADFQLYEAWSKSQLGEVHADYIELTGDFQRRGDDALLCYGCITTVLSSSTKSLVWINSDKQDALDDISRYILTDEED
ncbi:LAMI_0B02036g1_1 [Lachancea mirantina]|uniref:Cytoplasmic tRNA 2-thiolation protein 2 n=1 Tax=Lachancea mirantina TaxID=1230905 RepID=A0A1G4IUH1_9SACH|nr:LAMI_0B02036g1_1 [Lachancea mirantina]